MAKTIQLNQSPSSAKGIIYLILAKFWFIVFGYGIYFTLTRLLGPEKFGVYSIVISLISVFNAILITGTIQSVSKFTSEDDKFAIAIKNKALKVQTVLGGSIFIIFFLSANLIALFFNDPGLAFYFRLASVIMLFYSFYAVFVGYFNGLKHFKKQAFLDMTFSAIKLILVVLLVYLGYSITGAIIGFILAAFAITLISALLCGFKSTDLVFPAKKIIQFEILIFLFTLVINLLMNTDLFLIKALSPISTANTNAGYYAAASTIAKVPYQLIISITFVLFPLISKATFINDKPKAASYITNALRYSYMILLGIVVLISSNSKQIISLLYTGQYLPGSQALSIISFGILFFSLFTISTTIISGSGYPQISLIFATITLFSAIGLNYLLIPRLYLSGAALATSIAFLGGLLICHNYIKQKFNASFSGPSFLRISCCGVLIYLASIPFEACGLFLLVKFTCLGIAYPVLLFVTHELKKQDISLFKNLLSLGATN